MRRFDIIVIGAGAAGLNIAGFMNRAGFKVLLIDKSDEHIGGDCLNFGCVPSKSLIHVAKMVHHARRAKVFGITTSGVADISKVNSYIASRKQVFRKHESAVYFRSIGMTVVLGEATFTSKRSVSVSGVEYTAKRIVIATGSRPRRLEIPGADQLKSAYTNETIFSLEQLPKRLLVIGGGPIGLELGQAFMRLGSKVTIVQQGPEIAEKESPEISAILRAELEAEGMQFIVRRAHSNSWDRRLWLRNEEE